MLGRYSIELVMILLCGMGLHDSEIQHDGTPGTSEQFREAGLGPLPSLAE